MSKRMIFSVASLLFLGAGAVRAQSVSAAQMDERFSDRKLPYGWFTEGWKVDSTGVAKKKGMEMPAMTTENDSTGNSNPSFDLSSLMGGGGYNFLMTPPLSVQDGEILAFSAKKGKSSGMDSMSGSSDSTFVVERAVYGEHRWKKVADFTADLDSVFKTFTIASTEAGQYRFRFRAGGNVEIDSVAGFHIDMEAPDVYPVYQKKNILPIDLGLCEKDTTMALGIINTGTGTLKVALTLDGVEAYALDATSCETAWADTAKVNLTYSIGRTQKGRNSTTLLFTTSDERVEEIPLNIDAVAREDGVWTADFNDNTFPEGMFTEEWEAKEQVATVMASGGDSSGMGSMFGGSSTKYYLMTPPLTVVSAEQTLQFAVKKTGGDSGMGSFMGGGSNPFIVEKSVYGSGKWELAKDFTEKLDTVFTTQWLSNIEPGEYRFRFVASDSIVIDSVAGYKLMSDAPDMYVKLDTVPLKAIDLGLLRGDNVKAYHVINTGTGTLKVAISNTDDRYISLSSSEAAVAWGAPQDVTVTVRDNEEAQGEVSAAVIFKPESEKLLAQTGGIHAYVIPKDAWAEDFEPEYVIEDQTFPRLFPEGWTSTGWTLSQGSDDMMSMFGGGGGEKSWGASSDSKEYELVTPRLQAKQGYLLRFSADIPMDFMQMFGGGSSDPKYVSVYYKRDRDNDWTLYDTCTSSDTVYFKAPFSGYYRLKFKGMGVTLDNFLGFQPAQEDSVLKETGGYADLDGVWANVTIDRVYAAKDNGDGTWAPVARTVCLPYDFDLAEYYEQGRAKLYRMACVDTIYHQFVFEEAGSKIETGRAYLMVTNNDTIRLNAIHARINGVNLYPTPVYDYAQWCLNDTLEEVGSWNGVLEEQKADSVLNDNAWGLNDDGTWTSIANTYLPAYVARFTANQGYIDGTFNTNPGVRRAPATCRAFATKFYMKDEEGQGEVTDIPDLRYVGDVTALDGLPIENAIMPTIVTIDSDGTRSYYDLQGRRLSVKPRKGMYIENGKKHVAQ